MAAMRLALAQAHSQKPSTLLHSIFMYTVKTAAKTLAAASAASREGVKWRLVDHVRYMGMLMTWFTLWVLRVLMDHFPFAIVPSPLKFLVGLSPFSSSTSSSSSLQLVVSESFSNEGAPNKAIGRALTHIFGLLNDLPVSSRKYQFAIAMADRIVDENAHAGSDTLREINRQALSAAFARTAALLHRSLQTANSNDFYEPTTWPGRMLHALPLGSHLVSFLRTFCFFCMTNLFPPPKSESWLLQRQIVAADCGAAGYGCGADSVVAEKHAQELLWLANKMRASGAVEEAVVQWSFASALSSLAVTANARVQGSVVKISAILMREVARGEFETSRDVKFHLLALWLPLFCYASNGLTYPFLSGIEKTETERVIDEIISALPHADQEIILGNWLQDFSVSSSDWPNLQRSFDRWCRSSRKLLL